MLRSRLGVCGWPVSHSRSPAMHNAALAAVGLRGWRYQRLPLPPDAFEATVRALERSGFRGVNVTIPHKEAALRLADEASGTARAVGAANTLTFESGRVIADNTDVSAVLAALPSERAAQGSRALVLGAGGAARAAVHALVEAGIEDVQVWNRTPERAERLVSDLGGRAVRRPEPADIVIQCTSAGMGSSPHAFKGIPAPADMYRAGSYVVDMVYRAGGTAFLAQAAERGAEVIDGLEILVAQGADSFEIWTGRPAPRDVMRQAVADETT